LPIDPLSVPLHPHAARLRVEPFEPLLAKFAVGYPPPTTIHPGAQEILEHPSFAGHETISIKRNWNGYAKGRIEVHGLIGQYLLQCLALESQAVCLSR
jgi:hypothetical protein